MKQRTFLKLLIDLAMCNVYLMLTFADGVGDFFTKPSGSELARCSSFIFF